MKKRTGVLQTGFIPSTFEKEHHVLGGAGEVFEIIKEDGNYNDFIPEFEGQSKYTFDSYNCTAFGTLNTIEMYMSAAFGIKANYSERWVAIISKTKPPGNDPHTVIEAIMKYGLIPEEMLPFNEGIDTIEKYTSFEGGNEADCYAEGKRWKSKYQLNHKWAFTPDNTEEEKIHNMKVSYKLSPLSLAVFAWVRDARGLYVKVNPENHWVASSRYFDFQEIVDSYDPYKKKIDQPINLCKVISIKKKAIEPIQPLWHRLLHLLFRERLIFRKFKS